MRAAVLAAAAAATAADETYCTARGSALGIAAGHDLTGKVVLITGGESGIGYATALALASTNASVVTAHPNAAQGRAAVANITRLTGNPRVEFLRLDLASFNSTRRVAAAVLKKHRVVDVLINDAGVDVLTTTLTRDGFEFELQVNYIGHFLLGQLLLPALRASDRGKVIHVGSSADTSASPCSGAQTGCTDLDKLASIARTPCTVPQHDHCNYALSKFMMAYNAKELSGREAARGSKVRAYTVMPGYVDTANNKDVTPEENKEWCSKPACWAGWRGNECDTPCPQTPAAGGMTPTYLAVMDLPADAGGHMYYFCRPYPLPSWEHNGANATAAEDTAEKQSLLYNMSLDWTDTADLA